MRTRISVVALLACLIAAATVLAPAAAAAPRKAGAEAVWTKIADKGIDNPAQALLLPSTQVFAGKLYISTPMAGGGEGPLKPSQLWNYDGSALAKSGAVGFGDPNNIGIFAGAIFNGQLYAGTTNQKGAQLWRTPDGSTWERVGEGIIGGANCPNCYPIGIQDGKLLVSFDNYNDGVQVWSYDGTKFTRANEDGFGSAHYMGIAYPSALPGQVQVIAVDYQNGGFAPLLYTGGKTWKATAPVSFGDPGNTAVYVTSNESATMYAGTANQAGGQVWRYSGGAWSRVDIGVAQAVKNNAVFAYSRGGKLYVSGSTFSQEGDPTGTARVYRQKADGSFELWVDNGFGDPRNAVIAFGPVFKGHLLAGTYNEQGGQLWGFPVSPNIDKIDPASGPYGTLVTISGSTFGTPSPDSGLGSYVSFNGAKVYKEEVLSWTEGEIVLRVPEAATSGPVKVLMPGGVSNEVDFEVTLSKTYYFAEGTTRDNPNDGKYEEWVCIFNPNDEEVSVDVTYMYTGGARQTTKKYSVSPTSRVMVDVAADVGLNQDVSVKVTGDKTIVAERSIYFDYKNKWTGGDSVVGVPEPGETWYFAEGTTRDNPTDGTFEEWLCILNPNDVEANVRVLYMFGDGTTAQKDVRMPSKSRETRSVNGDVGKDRDVSIKVTSDAPVIAERPIYYDYHGEWPGGDTNVGTRYRSQALFFAEGCTYTWAQEWISILNPGASEATVTLTYAIAGAEGKTESVVVPPTSRYTVDVGAAVGDNRDVSVSLASNLPVIAERPMYFDYQEKWPGGDIGAGSLAPRTKIYFADGSTDDNETQGTFDEWLCIQNPNNRRVVAHLTFYRTDGATTTANVAIDPLMRSTFSVNAILGHNMDASLLVESDYPIVVERPMYFDYRGWATGGHDSYGYGL